MNDRFLFSVSVGDEKALHIGRLTAFSREGQYCVYLTDKNALDDEVDIVATASSISEALWIFDRELLSRKIVRPHR